MSCNTLNILHKKAGYILCEYELFKYLKIQYTLGYKKIIALHKVFLVVFIRKVVAVGAKCTV